MKRTFIAIPVSDATRRQIAAIRHTIPELSENVRLVTPENMHLTLKFLGDTEEKIIPEISRKLTTCLANIEPFEFVCGMTGCFPNIHKPRVLWLGITDGVRQVQAIARQVATALQDFGFQPEERAFCPHLTLGRVKNPRRAIPGLERFLKYEIIPTINPVENVIFYESNLTSGGAIYTRLAGFNLK